MARFGWEGIEAAASTLENRIHGQYATPTDGDGEGQSITVYLNVTTALHLCRCALYVNDKSAPIANGVTEEKDVPVGLGWVIFNFVGTKPAIVNAVELIIVGWGESESGDVAMFYGADSGAILTGGAHTYNSFPEPVGGTKYDDYNFSIFCDYTPAGAGGGGGGSGAGVVTAGAAKLLAD